MRTGSDIGVMGGMFDPVHNGHLRSALEVLEGLGLDEMRLVPAGRPAHRESTRADCPQRLAMLRLACAGARGLVVDPRECERDGTSYTFDTLTSLRAECTGARLFLLLGIDAYNILPTWHRWREIFNLAHVVILTRPGWVLERRGELGVETAQRLVSGLDEMKAQSAGRILCWDMTPLGISSSQVRKLISSGKSARYLLPDAVWDYIRTNELYARDQTGVNGE